MAEDKMVKDVRSRLKSIAAKGGKYFTGTARLFLASGTEIVNVNMPTLSGMMDVNRDLMNDTVRFLRNPVDTVNKNIDRAMSTEGWRAFQKFAKNAIDDLRTGELYDPMRDRSSFGEGIDALLDNFGDFDMSGFDEAGDYDEKTDNGEFDREVALAEAHEQAEDVRTQATLEAIGASTRATVNTANANAQTNIRMAIKQHAQLMGGMQNMVTQQAATLTAVNAMAASLLDVQREAHNQMMAQMQTMTSLLTEIRDNTAPKVSEKFEPPKENDFIGAYGQVDIRKWLKSAYKNADEKYGISSSISMATGGMDMKTMFELAGDNPLQLVTDLLLNQMFDKTGVKKSMERSGKYMQSFFPALMDKLAERGRRFGKTQEEGGGKLLDFFAGMLGVQTKAKGSIDTSLKDPSAQTMLTNRTVHAIEQVIPMWLSKIYSAVSGDPLQTYNYSTGKLTNVAQALAKQHHDVNDVAGRMGGAAYQVQRRAEAVKFAKVEDQEKFQAWMYEFLQNASRNGRHIDPWKSKEDWAEMLPESDKKEYFGQLARAILKTMPRSQLMALSAEASDARVSQSRAAATLNNDNRESGMGIIHSGMLGEDYEAEIEAAAKKKKYGISDYEVDKLVKNRRARAAQTGTGVYATNVIMSDMLSTLKRGIVTYTYIIGDSRTTGDATPGRRLIGPDGRPIGGGSNARPSIPGLSQDVLDEVLEEAGDVRERIAAIRKAKRDDDQRDREWRNEQQKQRDKERGRVLNITGMDDIIFTGDMNEDDMVRALSHIVASETKDNESDNPTAERSRGYITSHIQNFKKKIGFDPKKSLGQNVGDFLKIAPFELIKSGLELSDALMFKVIFGQDTEGLIDGTEDKPSLMRALSTSIKGHWKQAATWFGENIGKPLKNFLFNEKDGLMTRLGARVSEIFGEPIKRAGQKVKSSLIGEKVIGEDGKPTGRYEGGKLSNLINRTKDRAGSIKDSAVGGQDGQPSIIDTFLYGDFSDTKRKGVKYVRDRGSNGRFSGGHYEYQGFIGRVKKAQDSFMDMMFGPDADGNDHDSKKKAKFVADELNKAAPDMIIGAGAMTAINAGMGLLTGLALPGGPLVAPLLGAGLSFVKSSETFKKFLFGDQIEEEQEHYDMKTGKMVKSRVKTRKGSDLISKEVYEGMKRFAPKVAIGTMAGALAGGIGLLPFGMGPIIGSVLGSIGGMTAASDQLKKLVFGDADSEEGDDSGLISKNFRKKLLKGIAEHGGGAVVGRLAGGAAGLLAGGILPGAFGAILGPVLGTAGTVIGAVSGPKLMDMLFGEEQTVDKKDDEGNPTGEKVTKRVGGLFGKMFDGVRDRMVKPLAKGIDTVGHKIGDWFQESVVDPFSRALQPMKDAMKHAGEAVGGAMKNLTDNISGHIRDAMNNVLGTAVEHPLKDFFKEKVLKPLNDATNKIFSTIGKIIGNIISAPFKAVEYIFAGTIGGKTPEELKDEKRQKKDAERRAKLSDKFGKAQESLQAAGAKFGNMLGWFNRKADATKADAEADVSGQETKEKKRGFFGRLADGWRGRKTKSKQGDPTGTGAVGNPDEITSATGTDGRGPESNQRRWVQNRENGKFVKGGHYEDVDSASPSGAIGKPSDTAPKAKADKAAQSTGTSDERSRLKDKAAARSAERQEREKAATTERDKREDKKVKAEAASTARDNGKKKSNKTDNEYLKDIEKHSRALPGIYDEIKGQLGNTGWNLGYIKTLLEKHFGKLSAEELPEEMEGSRKNVKKRRGFFGKMFDRVAGVFGGIGEAIRDKVTGVLDIVLHPFRLFGKIVGGIVDGVKAAGETLWGIVKTFGAAMGEVIKGAAQGLGSVLAGAGKIIYNAAGGIGKALGDVLSTLTGVLKDGILGISAVVRGLVETAATIAPDIAKAAWKGMKFVGGMVGKGIKFAAEGVAGGVSWLFNKITGRGEGGERTKTKIKKLGKFVIDGGFLDEIKKPIAVAVGGDAGIPFPFVRLLKGRLSSKSNIAIPVYIMGSEVSGGSGEGEQKGKGSVQNSAPVNPVADMGGTGNLNTDIPVQETAEPTPDIVNGVKGKWVQNRGADGKFTKGKHFVPDGQDDQAGKPQGAKPKKASLRETATNAAFRAKTEIRRKVDAFKRKYFNVDRRAERSATPAEEYDRAMQSATSEEEIEAIQAAQQMNTNNQIVAAGGSGEGEQKEGGFLSGLLDMLTGGKTKGLGKLLKSPLASILAAGAATVFHFTSDSGNKAWGAEIAGNEILKQTGLRSLSPAQMLEFIKNPQAAQEFAEQTTKKGAKRGATLLGGLGNAWNGLKNTVSDFRFLTNADNIAEFGGDIYQATDNKMATILAKAANSKAGMAIRGGATNLISGAKSLGSKAIGAIKGSADDIMRVAAGTADDAVKLGPVRNAIAKAIGALMNNKVVQSAFGALKSKIPQITSKLSKFIGGEVLEKAMKSGAASAVKNGAKQIAAFASGGLLAIGFAIYDFTSGMGNAKKYFKVFGSDVTLGMRLTAGICNCLGGLIGLIPVVGPIISIALALFMDKIVQLVYGLVADESAKAELEKDQKELETATAEYNQANGTSLTTEEYAKKFNADGSKVTFWSKAKTAGKQVLEAADGLVSHIPVVGSVYKGAKKVVGGVVDGVKAVGEFASGLLPWNWGKKKDEDEEEETGKGPGGNMSAMIKKMAKMGMVMVNPATGLAMAGGKVLGSIGGKVKSMFGGDADNSETSGTAGKLSSLVTSLADKITGAIQNVKGVADENGLDTSSIGGLIKSSLKDPKALLNTFMTIGKGVGNSLVDMVTSVFKDKKQAPTIFSIMGEGLGNSLVADLKNTEGKNATITNSMSTAMVTTLSGGGGSTSSINAIKKTTKEAKKKSGFTSWLPWNWGKGPGNDDDEWGHGPVSPMSQSAGKWNRGSQDMARNGCGPTAAAMVASAYGAKGANPGEANRMSYNMGMRASDGGTNPNFFSQYASGHGFGMSEGPANAARLSQNLRNGQPAVVMGKGGAFGKNMHYMVADRATGRGSVGLVDPLTGSRKTTTMKGLMNNTKTALYSYGRGAWGRGYEDEAENYDENGNLKGVSDQGAAKAAAQTGGSYADLKTQATGGNPLNKPYKVTSPFGNRNLTGVVEGHKGVDLVPTDGSGQADVGSRWNGTVKSVKRNLPNTHTGLGVKSDQAGNYVIITTDDGYTVKHFHLKYGSIPDAIQPGARVTIGQKLGEMGTTGRSTGPHLHYQLEDSKGPFDPLPSVSGGTTLSGFTNGATTAAVGTASASTTGSSGTSSDGSSTTGSTGVAMLDALSTVFSSISGKLGNLLTILMGGTPDSDMEGDNGGKEDTSAATTTGGSTFNFGSSAGTVDPTEYKSETWKWLRRDFGLTEPGAAGLMGCWQSESGVNPARLEGDYLGGWKKKWGSVNEVLSSNSNLNDYVLNYLFPAYDRSNISISKSGYKMADGNYYPGLGLAQWTKGRAYNLLQFAQSNGLDWRDLTTQLKFFQHETSQSFPKLKASLNAAQTAEEGARAALDGFEMYSGWSSTTRGQKQWQERAKNAAQIYNTFQGTSISDTPEGTYVSTGNAQDDIWKRGEGLRQVAAPGETGIGSGWGHGPAVDMSATRDATMAEVRKLNKLMSKTREEAESGSTVSAIADTITKAIGGGASGSDESTTILKTIATTLGTMVDLLTKISKNTEQGETSDMAGDSASATNKRRSNLPVVSPLYPNQDKKPEDVGLTVINQLTTV